MTTYCVAGGVINHGPANRQGFDAFCANEAKGLYAMCDGANSCPHSGQAALWLCEQITQAPLPKPERLNFEPLVRDLHQKMLLRFPNTATTLIGVQVAPQGLRLVSVGDSELAVFEHRWWGSWRKLSTMPKDLDAHGHPSQMIASEVLNKVHQLDIPAQRTLLALMMSDGPARVLSEADIDKVIQKIKRQTPTSDDLNYFCQSLANQALASGCEDDVSVVLIWIRYG